LGNREWHARCDITTIVLHLLLQACQCFPLGSPPVVAALKRTKTKRTMARSLAETLASPRRAPLLRRHSPGCEDAVAVGLLAMEAALGSHDDEIDGGADAGTTTWEVNVSGGFVGGASLFLPPGRPDRPLLLPPPPPPPLPAPESANSAPAAAFLAALAAGVRGCSPQI